MASASTRQIFTLDTGKTEMCITLISTRLFKVEFRLNYSIARLEASSQDFSCQGQWLQERWASTKCTVSVNSPVTLRGDEVVVRHLDEGVGRHPRACTTSNRGIHLSHLTTLPSYPICTNPIKSKIDINTWTLREGQPYYYIIYCVSCVTIKRARLCIDQPLLPEEFHTVILKTQCQPQSPWFVKQHLFQIT